MKLYHMPRSRSVRVIWLCEEMGLDIELVPGNFREPSPEFLAVNPSRTVPAFVDGEVVLTESLAIMMYLAERHGPTPLNVMPDEPGYGDFLQFFVLGEAGLGAPLNPAIATRFTAPDDQKDNFTFNAIMNGFDQRMTLVDRQLAHHEFLAADRFTLADISVAFILGVASGFLGATLPTRVADYHARVTARPSYQRATAR